MLFNARCRNATYVVAPSNYSFNARGERSYIRGLRVEFKEHTFDSKKSAREQGWSEDDEAQVVQYLMTHPHFNNAGNDDAIYLVGMDKETPEDRSMKKDAEAAVASGLIERCLYFDAANNMTQCEKTPVKGEQFCQEHFTKVMKVGAA